MHDVFNTSYIKERSQRNAVIFNIIINCSNINIKSSNFHDIFCSIVIAVQL